jgi:parallel beta-helix repeat protein
MQKASQLALILLLSLLTYTFDIQPTHASTVIYIRANGNVDPPTAPIQRNGDVYAFTDNIQGLIIVEKDNIVIDGAFHTLRGTGSETGIDLSGRKNVTIQKLEVKNFDTGVYLSSSSQITIQVSTISQNNHGIWISRSSGNNILQNNITENVLEGIYVYISSDNNILGNNITKNTFDGIYLYSSTNNTIHVNIIMCNGYGISPYFTTNNKIFHNHFIENEYHVDPNTPLDIWDNGYPSGGNYWSDYTGTDNNGDGICDNPYYIDDNNQDRYPLITTHDIEIQNLKTSKTIVCQGYTLSLTTTTINYGINSENIHITLYANTTIITTNTVTLKSISSTLITFTWNTTGFAKGNYTILAYATPVQGESHIADNTLVNGLVTVTMVGDINADDIVDIFDCVKIALIFGSTPSDPNWNPNADINNDNTIDIFDLVIVAIHFAETSP